MSRFKTKKKCLRKKYINQVKSLMHANPHNKKMEENYVILMTIDNSLA
jgi:hypothetical protein